MYRGNHPLVGRRIVDGVVERQRWEGSTVEGRTEVDHGDFGVAVDGRDGRIERLLARQVAEGHAQKLVVALEGQRPVLAVEDDADPLAHLRPTHTLVTLRPTFGLPVHQPKITDFHR